jgi:hypothetical protein
MLSALAVEWSKARAQSHRSLEALDLLCSEATWALNATEHEHREWLRKAAAVKGDSVGDLMYDGPAGRCESVPILDDQGLAAGRRSYAYFQADTEARLLRKLSALFHPVLIAVLAEDVIPRFDMPKVQPVQCSPYLPSHLTHFLAGLL